MPPRRGRNPRHAGPTLWADLDGLYMVSLRASTRRGCPALQPDAHVALYCSLPLMTPCGGTNQVGTPQPMILASYDAELADLFDIRYETLFQAEGMDAVVPAATRWRNRVIANGEARMQMFARTLIGNPYSGLLVRSFAPGASGNDLNLVLCHRARGLPYASPRSAMRVGCPSSAPDPGVTSPGSRILR